jgi:hypothetical protein
MINSSWLQLADGYKIKATDIGINSGVHNLGDLFRVITQTGMILIGMLSVIFIIVGGLQMIGAAGSPQRFRQARETVLYAIVGLIIAISAYAIVTFVVSGAK